MEISSLQSWFPDFDNYPFIIAGPCSAESEEQVMSTAAFLKSTGRVSLFRAGVWKPRTRPGTFNGYGIKALKWLENVKKEHSVRIAVEVASPKHLEASLKHGIDVVWLGARTVSNPFSVEEICSALHGVDIPVMIKNPLSPDIDLWQGAVERVYAAGIKRIAAIHRGFSPFERTLYRNMPKWEIPIELRQRINNLPVICDPSHIAGRSDFVWEISQKALDLTMSGLMIEVHPHPEVALSDAAQQLSFNQLGELLDHLIIRKSNIEDSGLRNQLTELRNQIDSIDYQLIELLADRMRIAVKMGEYKFMNNITVLQMERWLGILKTRTEQGLLLNLDASFLERVLTQLHQESIRIQTGISNKMSSEDNHWSEEQ
jgi:chorismate mutase